jgi:hypothetical protein
MARSPLAGGLLLRDFGDRQWQQLPLAEELAYLPRRVALDDAF